MATIQVRDVPDAVAEIIAEKAASEHQSTAAYLRDLMRADAERELQRRKLAAWDAKLVETQRQLGLHNDAITPSSAVVREVRDEYEQGDE